MEGDTVVVDGFSYQIVDDQRCQCLTCSKIIYKLLQRAHSNSHAGKSPVKEVKAVKKSSVQPDFNELKKKRASNEMMMLISRLQKLKGSLGKIINTYERAVYVVCLKAYRKWKLVSFNG